MDKEKVLVVPEDLIFYPCQVSGVYWGALTNLMVWLSDPNQLADLYNEDPKKYYSIIKPLQDFVGATENDLKAEGLLVEKEV